MWTDYLCPWCYLGSARSTLLSKLGVTVIPQPFELHPGLPPGGRPVPEPARVYRRIARECDRVGLPFRPPAVVPNSRLALEAAEVVRASAPEAFAPVHAGLFHAYFVEGADLGDPLVVGAVVAGAGLDSRSILDQVRSGAGREAVDASRERAFDHGIASTPSWLIDGRYVVAGVQPEELFVRAVERLRARPGPA